MKRFFAFLVDPRFLGFLGVIALSLAVWFGGAYIRVGDSEEPLSAIVRLSIIMVIVVLWGLNNLRVQAKQNKQNKEMLGDIEESVKAEPVDDVSDLSSEEAKVLHSRFKDAIETLKSHRFGDKKKRKTLYELPWYIIIGPPGAGKTTVLVNSGLQFPLKEKFGLQGVGGVGGTRNCDWWFTDDAVLIDTAGRYTTQDSHGEADKGAWQNFLKLLKKHRPRRAINGAVVAVSLHELMMLSREERQSHADTIRLRIQELMTDLGVKFPIYFLLTKADLMAGFNEFFEYLDQTEREQVWGVSFPLGQANGPSFFESEFEQLVRKINERLLWRLHQERDPYRRAKIQGFPSQFENMRSVLVEFVNSVFAENKYQSPPLLRGVYFTSGTQEGSPIDRIVNTLSSSYGVQARSMAPPPGQGKSFFIHRLLKDVIFPEADIVGVNTRYEGRLKWGRRLAMFATVLVIVGAGIAWTSSLNKNEELMAEVSSLVDEHKAAIAAKNTVSNRFDAALAIVTPLQKATQVYDQLQLPWITSLGLYDASVQEAADKAFDASLQAHFNPVLVKRLESYLIGTKDNDSLYDALRVYLMMGDSSLIEKDEVRAWFKADWERSFENQASKQTELLGYLDQSLANGIPAFQYRDAVVNSTRNQLRKIPIEQRIYKQIERTPELKLETDLVQAIGGDILDVFEIKTQSQTLTVPFMFTKAGYDQMDFSKDSPLIRKYATEQWILGSSAAASEDYSDKDIEKIGEKVKAIYLSDYIKTWKALINQFAIRSFSNSSNARDALGKMADQAQSPLLKTLKVVANETGLTPEVNLLQGKDGAVADAAAALAAKAAPPTAVDTEFKTIRHLITQNKANELIEAIKQLHETLEEFSFAPIPNEASLKFASKRFVGSGSDPIRKLLARASKQPQPVRRWLEELADQSWKVVLIDSKRHLNTLWQATVYQPYESSIKGQFPFVKSANEDVALLDFAEYFKPEGIEESFVKQHLNAFVKKGKKWTEKSLNGRSLGIASSTLKQMQKAAAIREVFFRKNDENPGLNYKLKPSKLDSTVRRVEVNLGKDSLRYSHGPKLSKSLSWPGTTGDGIRVLFEDINETKHNERYSGDWSFFRLLEQSNVTPTKRSNEFLVTFNVGHRSAEYLLSATSALNPFASGWLAQYQCPELL